MKIALIRPTVAGKFQIVPPISLGYLASSLRKNGYSNIHLVDGSFEQYTAKDAVSATIEKNPDLIGIQVYSGSQNWAREFCCKYHKNGGQSPIIVGGPHITALQDLAMEHIGADFGCIGEGEGMLVKLADHLSGKKKHNFEDIEGLIYKENNIYKNSKIPFARVDDLDNHPYPAWDLMPIEKYAKSMEGATTHLKGKKPAIVLSSRGCPFQCTFCSTGLVYIKKFRARSPKVVVDEIEYLIKKYGADEIIFSDDNLTLDLDRAEKIFDLILERKLKFHWRAPNGLRIDCLTEKIVEKMKKTGCYSVGLGIETGDKELMKKIKKNLNLDIVYDITELFNKYKILSSGFFIVGMPDETEETYRKTVDFALKLPLKRIQVSIFTPQPGAEEFDRIFRKENRKAFVKNIKNYLYNEKIPKFLKYLTSQQVHKYQKEFLRKFYLRPKIVWSLTRHVNFSQIKAAYNHPFIQRWFDKDSEWFYRIGNAKTKAQK